MPDASDQTEALLNQVVADWTSRVGTPRATYRLQFHRGFTFRDATRLVPYLDALGISHCYASPYLKARPGSSHGYDITDHSVLNPEIGTDADYEEWVQTLQDHGMSHIADIVPNHMGIAGNDNPWWNDVLENGLLSPHARFFDIGWYTSPRPELREKILLPILGDPYGKVLEAGQIQLVYADGSLALRYYDHRFPVTPRSCGLILKLALPTLQGQLAADSPSLLEFQSIQTAINNLPTASETDPEKAAEGLREKEVIKRRILTLCSQEPLVQEALVQAVKTINGNQKDPHSYDMLDNLLGQQVYRLSYWRVASDEINYRRFFDVNELAALNMELPEVFAATHCKILQLAAEGKIAGLRIDHPDGLYDPKQYLDRLQTQFLLLRARSMLADSPEFSEAFLAAVEQRVAQRQPPPLFVLVEKILADNETLPDDWQTSGTTGYEFLNMVNGLFVHQENAREFTRLYLEWTQNDDTFADVAYRQKFLILQVAMSSELHMLAYQLDRLAQKNRLSRDFTLTTLRHALREVIVCFPVYRTYIADDTVREADRKVVLGAVARAKAKNPAINNAVFHFVRDMLLLKYPDNSTEADREEQRHFAGKFQQVTAPVTAKGIEDTAFYVYNRLLSLNEVGGNPARFGIVPAYLHQFLQERHARWPHALSSSSTHDSKRSEDVRARLNILSEMPGVWREHLQRWSKLNEAHRVMVDDLPVPDANEEYFLYQTLLGAWPLEPYRPEEYTEFVQRIQAYMMKALHEAKVHTSWINPNQAYDDAIQQFIGRILDPKTGEEFLREFAPLQQQIARLGLYNSLSQALIKLTAPGIPDIYQGTDLWDFSLVDPDNRRPVDYELRRSVLADLQAQLSNPASRRNLLRDMLTHPQDGRIKLFVTLQALTARQKCPDLFANGDYLPLEVTGSKSAHLFGFARRYGNCRAVVAVPRLVAGLFGDAAELPDPGVWEDTAFSLPAAGQWENALSAERVVGRDNGGKPVLLVAETMAAFPVILLLSSGAG